MIEIKLPGQPFPRIDKRAGESVTYLLNCSVLLEKNELVVSATPELLPSGVAVSNIRTRKGTVVEVKVTNTPLTTAAYSDFTINLLLNTTFNNTRLATFVVRAYK